ncbi:MAG TPA: ClC family H(+)/Cl(-) exchange transporter [Candidatus Tetragenococcus pullicola]|nr:ClC family H(+)/Cl(-) exchange transporter [Candidatus Tetragenococcus pullicola]
MKKIRSYFKENTRILFIGKGIIVGTGAGIIVSVFRLLIEKISENIKSFYQLANSEPFWLIPWALFSIVVAIFVGKLIKNEPNIKGSGIPQVEGMLQEDIHYSWFSVLWKKFVGGVLSVGAGLFLGREGPSIQLGATIGQAVSEHWKAPTYEKKILISSGASAGLAAAFNAPIAGLLFVIEEVHHGFSPLVWLTSFASAVTANFISQYIFGLEPVLFLGKILDIPLRFYGWLLLLGIFLGIMGWIYQKCTLALPDLFKRVPFPIYFHGIIPFLLVIPIGYFAYDILGGGNQLIVSLPKEAFSLKILVILFLVRFIFSMISYGASLPGGIFLPILTLGAILGALFAKMVGIPDSYIKDFVIVAMAGYFTAIGKAPLTAIILVTEMVGSINHLMPLGLVSLVAYVTNDLLGGHPIYESMLERLVEKEKIEQLERKTTIEFTVTAESLLDGLSVRDFPWPENCLLISIRRSGQEILPHGDTIIKFGDILVLITEYSQKNNLRKLLQQNVYQKN